MKNGDVTCVRVTLPVWESGMRALVADLRTQALTYYVYCLRQKRNAVAKESKLKREKRESENPRERHVVGGLGCR